jgi:hypothetical protein
MKTKFLSKLRMIGWVAVMPMMAFAGDFQLDRAEIQSFERSYEAWVQDLVHQVSPKSRANVIVEFNYSSNPDLIQNFEEKMAASHLPGVPEMIDLDMHPLQHPIYDLVTRQSVKVILENKPSEQNLKVMRDLISSKIFVDAKRGDRVEFDFIKTENHLNRNAKIALIALFVMGVAGALLVMHQRRQRKSDRKMTAQKLNDWYDCINPIASMTAVDAATFMSFIREQNHAILVEAMAHANLEFFQAVLKSFNGEARITLYQEFERYRLKVSQKKSRYAQIYLLAKLKDRMNVEAIQKVDSLVEAIEQVRAQREAMEMAMNEMKNSSDQPAAVTAEETAENMVVVAHDLNQEKNGVGYEQSI